jgi:predicted HTH domain antitoxin
MDIKVITGRVPEEHFRDLKRIEKEEHADRATVIRKLLAEGIKQWKIKRAIDLLRAHKVTLRKAASMAGITYVEMLDLASKYKIDIGYSLEELEKDMRGLQ